MEYWRFSNFNSPNLSFRKLFPSLIAIREGAGGELKIAIRASGNEGDERVKNNFVLRTSELKFKNQMQTAKDQ